MTRLILIYAECVYTGPSPNYSQEPLEHAGVFRVLRDRDFSIFSGCSGEGASEEEILLGAWTSRSLLFVGPKRVLC